MGEDNLPENIRMKSLQNAPNFTRYLPKNIFPKFFFGGGGVLSPSPTPMRTLSLKKTSNYANRGSQCRSNKLIRRERDVNDVEE